MEMFNVEITLFNIIGYGLLLGSALTVLLPVIVWIGNVICACLWEFIDEGETPYKAKGKFLYFSEVKYPTPVVVPVKCGHDMLWAIKVEGKRKGYGDIRYVTTGGRSLTDDIYNYSTFSSQEDAQKLLDKMRKAIDSSIADRFDLSPAMKDHMYLNFISVPVGLGFLFIPTITLFSGAAILSLYSMRWARRGVKLAKKVKSSLDSHISDKDAHKE